MAKPPATDATGKPMLHVGRINGLYGVRGWVKVYSYTDPIENILEYTPWQLWRQGAWQTVNIADGRPLGKGIIVLIDGYSDRDASALLLGSEIAIYREQLPAPEADEYYWLDLIGLKVINQAQQNLGTVTSLIETGAHDVLVIKDGDHERLIPFVLEQFVLAVDIAAGTISVDWDADF